MSNTIRVIKETVGTIRVVESVVATLRIAAAGPQGPAGTGSSPLDALTDVTITSPSTNQLLQYNGSQWVNATVSFASNLDGLTDVTISSPGGGQVLRYNGTTWVNVALAYSDLTGVPSTFAPSAHTLNSHSNVAVSAPSAGDILSWNGTAWFNEKQGSLAIDWAQLMGVPSTFTPSAHNQAWSTITATPTTLSGYGITNAVANTVQVIAGTGLSGGGALSSNVTLTVSYGTTSTTACVGNDARLSDARTPLTHTLLSHSASGLTTNHVLVATSATTYGFAAITAAMLPSDVARTSISNTFGSGQTITADLTVNNVAVPNAGFLELREATGNGVNHVRHKATAALSANTTYEWPNGNFAAAPPSVLLLSNSGGVLSWYTTPASWHYERVYGYACPETPNGSVTAFTFGVAESHQILTGSVAVFLNGVRQYSTEVAINEGLNTATFTTAPATGDVVRVDYNHEGFIF